MKTEKFKEGRDRGTEYLLKQLHPNGQFGDSELGVTDYYKVPTAFQVSGQTQVAKKDLKLILIIGKPLQISGKEDLVI